MNYIFEHFLGTIVNFFAVIAAGVIGTLIKKGIPERYTNAIMAAMSICVIYIGVDGMLEPAPQFSSDALSPGLVKVLVMIVSMAIGTALGELIDIDKGVNKLGELIEKKLGRLGKSGNFAKGFVSCSLLFCVGAMAVNGAILDAGGEPDVLLAKSVIDAISCVVMASSLGIGCAFSAILVLVYQGVISAGALLLFSALPASAISYMSITGSLIIIFIGTNVLGVTKIRTANMVPAIFVAPLVEWLIKLIFA